MVLLCRRPGATQEGVLALPRLSFDCGVGSARNQRKECPGDRRRHDQTGSTWRMDAPAAGMVRSPRWRLRKRYSHNRISKTREFVLAQTRSIKVSSVVGCTRARPHE